MRLRRLVKFLIFSWISVIIGWMNSNPTGERPDVQAQYNVQTLFSIPEQGCNFSIASIFQQAYPKNYPARAAPEPRGPL